MKDYGENEPDTLDFESHGLQCALRRGPMGSWCGYAAIPVTHPLHNVGYHQSHPLLTKLWKTRQHEPIGNAGIIPLFCADSTKAPSMDVVLAVHGSITYSGDRCPLEDPDGKWWIGFDCSHAGDIIPEIGYNCPGNIYRTIHYARGECEALAGQLAAVTTPRGKTMKRLLAHCAMLLFIAVVLRWAYLASVLP